MLLAISRAPSPSLSFLEGIATFSSSDKYLFCPSYTASLVFNSWVSATILPVISAFSGSSASFPSSFLRPFCSSVISRPKDCRPIRTWFTSGRLTILNLSTKRDLVAKSETLFIKLRLPGPKWRRDAIAPTVAHIRSWESTAFRTG